MNELAALYGGWILLVIVVAIVWILLPFAIFGTKPILREILRELREQTRDAALERGDPDTHVLCPSCREPVRDDASKCRYCLTALVRRPPPVAEPKKRMRDFILPRK